MSFAKTSADKLGLVAVLALAGVLAALLVINGSGATTDAAIDSQRVVTNAQPDSQDPAPVPTTQALALPATALPATAAQLASSDVSLAALIVEQSAKVQRPLLQTDDDPLAVTTLAVETDAGGSETDQTAAESVQATTATTTTDASAAPSAAATEASAATVPNPQLPAAEPTATVPNPQLPAAEPTATVPNPQLPAADGSAATTAPASTPADAPRGGTFTHTLTASVARPSLHTAPGGPQFTPTFNGVALPAVNPTVFGNALVYRVLAGEPGDAWAKVYVPARPNGTTAWVQTSQFNWGSSNRLLQINVTERTVTVFEGGNVILTSSAVLGGSSSPTPLAEGWVEETMAGPSSAYGPLLISLGIFSDALNSFAGGIPKIALHGTNQPNLMGQYASNGCIRVPNDVVTQVAGLMPPGSKVQIVG